MASGDITPTTPRQDTGLVLRRITIIPGASTALVTFVDAFGTEFTASVVNGTSIGFNYAAATAVSVSTPTGFNDLMTQLTLTNAKKTAAIQSLVTAGVIAITGTVA